MLPEAISSGPTKKNCQMKRNAIRRPQRLPNESRRKTYAPPEPGIAAPSSLTTSPSARAMKAPTNQQISACGPPIAPRIKGTVMKGPMLTMFDMLMEVAFKMPKRRCRRVESLVEGSQFDGNPFRL